MKPKPFKMAQVIIMRLEPGTRLIDRTPGLGEIHEQQCDAGRAIAAIVEIPRIWV